VTRPSLADLALSAIGLAGCVLIGGLVLAVAALVATGWAP
jgi:hypothetical protein